MQCQRPQSEGRTEVCNLASLLSQQSIQHTVSLTALLGGYAGTNTPD